MDVIHCSEFARDILVIGNVIDDYKFKGVVKPIDFLKIDDYEDVYIGNLNDYLS